MDDTTPPANSGDNQTPQDDWQSQYAGLQKVVAKRDTELTTATTSLDQLRKEHEQALADLATYRQREVDAGEEEQAKAQFESLKECLRGPPARMGERHADALALRCANMAIRKGMRHMPATPDRARPAPAARHDATTAAISDHDIAEVFRTLGLEDEQSRRRYLEWSEVGNPEAKPGFEVIERGDTRFFE